MSGDVAADLNSDRDPVSYVDPQVMPWLLSGAFDRCATRDRSNLLMISPPSGPAPVAPPLDLHHFRDGLVAPRLVDVAVQSQQAGPQFTPRHGVQRGVDGLTGALDPSPHTSRDACDLAQTQALGAGRPIYFRHFDFEQEDQSRVGSDPGFHIHSTARSSIRIQRPGDKAFQSSPMSVDRRASLE